MATEATAQAKVIVAETKALAALTFYAHNYTNLMFAGLGAGNTAPAATSARTQPSTVASPMGTS
jgi:hypothetical protein